MFQYHFSTRLTTISVHPRHGGGDARKAHVGHSRYCESLEILCLSVDMLHYFSFQLSTRVTFILLPSTIAIVDRYAKKAYVGRSKYCESRNCTCFCHTQYHFSARLTTSSVHLRHVEETPERHKWAIHNMVNPAMMYNYHVYIHVL